MTPIARRLLIMPLFILAAKVCPKGQEATVFALLTAVGCAVYIYIITNIEMTFFSELRNFGSSLSSQTGALLLDFYDIEVGSYDNLSKVIVIKSVCRFLPILLVPLLIPPGAPHEESDVQNERDNKDTINTQNFDDKHFNTVMGSATMNPMTDKSPFRRWSDVPIAVL